MREETTEWLASAAEDLTAAQVLCDAGQYHAMALHAQQAVEKALKGLLVERTGELPARTHDLRRIGAEVGVPPEMLARLVELYAYYLAGRYPGTAHGDAQVRAHAGGDRRIGDRARGARLDAGAPGCAGGASGERVIAEPLPADRRLVEAFIASLRGDGIMVTTLIWYGSRSRRAATHPGADFDLIVVAPEFGGLAWVERLVAAYAHWPITQAADILCYTPDEFDRLARRASIVREAVQTGRRLTIAPNI